MLPCLVVKGQCCNTQTSAYCNKSYAHLVAKVWAAQSQEAAASQVGSSHTFVEGTAGVGTGRPAAAG